MRNKYLQFGLGMIVGGLLCGTTAAAADYLTARPTTQTFYLSGQSIQFEAYEIHGNNFVKLRDIGQAVDFGVTYDAAALKTAVPGIILRDNTGVTAADTK